jgi:hypothetical protein
MAVTIDPSDDRQEFFVTGRGPEVWYGGQRLLESMRLKLEEGSPLQLGPELTYQTFTPFGFLRYLSFRLRMERALPPPTDAC